jgi:hypothetical protein
MQEIQVGGEAGQGRWGGHPAMFGRIVSHHVKEGMQNA